MSTIKQRLDALEHGFILLECTLAADRPDLGMRLRAALAHVRELSEEAYWLRCALPEKVLDMKAPTADETEKAGTR